MTFTEILEYAIKNKWWLTDREHLSICKDDISLVYFVRSPYRNDENKKTLGTLNDILFGYDSDFCRCWFGDKFVCPICGEDFDVRNDCCDIGKDMLSWQYHQRQLLGLNENEVVEYLGRFK